MSHYHDSVATLGFKLGTGMIRPTSALQPLHLNTFISSVGAASARRKQLEALEAENLRQQQFAELRSRGFQARRDREAREQAERRAQRRAQQEADWKEKQFRRKYADMWITPKLVPLALPPSLIRGDFLDTFMPSDLRFRCLFPNDAAKRARMKDLVGEYGALHDYTNWAGAMISEPEYVDGEGRRRFFERLAGVVYEDTVAVLREVERLFLEATELGRFEYCFLTDAGKTDDLVRRLMEGRPSLMHESGLYSCVLEPTDKPGKREIWEKYGHLVPTELERFNHSWLGKDGDTADLRRKLIPASNPDAVFKDWSPPIRAHYAHLIPTLMEQFEYEYSLRPDLVASRLEIATDAQINSMPSEWHEKYGFLVAPSLYRFHKKNNPDRIEYIRVYEYEEMVEEWDLEVVDAYPPYSDLERFEKREEVHRPEYGGHPSGIDALKFKLLRNWNAEAYLEKQGKEVVAKYGYLVPTEAQRFEFEHIRTRKDGTKTLRFLPKSGSVWDKWSLAIKSAYEHLHPTDLELFEEELINENGDLSKMEVYLMQKGKTAFEGHGEEVRRKWAWLCPTSEERFEYCSSTRTKEAN